MKKLELRHLAPYLPYGLKIKEGALTYLLSGLTDSSMLAYECGDNDKETFDIDILDKNVKIPLRPLSDLTKEIEVNGEKFVPIGIINDGHSITYNEKTDKFLDDALVGVTNADGFEFGVEYTAEYLPYTVIQKMFEWHFDVFGLIENGLAVNINEL